MRAITFGVAAFCVQVGLSVPHGNNQVHRHGPRQLLTKYSTITDVVTVTANNAVIWVDQFNNVISTEYRTQGNPAAGSSTVNVPVVTATVSDTTASIVASSPPYLPTETLSNSPPPFTPPSSTPGSAVIPTSSAQGGGSTTAVPATSSSSPGAPDTNTNVNNGNSTASVGSGFGVCYELIKNNACVDAGTLAADFAFLASQGFSKIRVYDIGCDLGPVVAAAAAQGLQVVAGLNSIANVGSDMNKLAGMINGNWGPVDTIVVGNEVVNNGGDPAAVVAAIGTARGILTSAGFKKNVVAVDTFIALENHPEICAASDYCAANCHAFFDPNTAAAQAGSFVAQALGNIAKGSNGKAVVITESGWPWQGQSNGKAIPSPENQQAAISSLRTAFAGNPGNLFLFQAYDATYKAPGALGVEQFFGIYGH